MYLIKKTAYTPTLRHKIKITSFFCEKFKKNYFQLKIKKFSGRNNFGKIVVRHKGGSKILNRYTRINHSFLNFIEFGVLIKFIVNNNSNSLVGLIKFLTGSYTYFITPQHGWYGSFFFWLSSPYYYKVKSNFFIKISLIKYLRLFELFYCLAVNLISSAKYARSAGVYCRLISMNKFKQNCVIELPAKKKKIISTSSICVIGRVSNIFFKKEIQGKAGFYRLVNFRPTVRGVAMNPVDHPHGGRTKTNSPEVTPWNKIAKYNK